MDLIIIGNGTAGLIAALYAAKLGLKTLIIGKPPASIPSGGFPLQSVHPGLETLLERLDALKALEYSRRATYSGIWINGEFKPLSPDINNPWFGSHISKSAFEFYLAFCLRQKQVELIENDALYQIDRDSKGLIIKLQSGRLLYGRYLIDASGNSRVAGRMLGLKDTSFSKPLTASTSMITIPAEQEFPYRETSFEPESSGFTWFAPETRRCTWTRLRTTESGDRSTSVLPLMIANSSGKVYYSNVRWRAFDQVAANNVFLIGDAAGMLDPGTGQGILNACWTAISATESIAAVIHGPLNEEAASKSYNDWFQDFFHFRREKLRQHYLDLEVAIF